MVKMTLEGTDYNTDDMTDEELHRVDLTIRSAIVQMGWKVRVATEDDYR